MPDLRDQLIIDLDGVESHLASRYASELRDHLLAEDSGLTVEQVRGDTRTQDFGATLLLVLGSGATLAVARGIQRWIALRSTSKVVVRHGDRRVEVTNLPARRAERLATELTTLLDGTEPDGDETGGDAGR